MVDNTWLDKIESPDDLKGLNLEALQSLARELRRYIAETCSRNGGHFAPSLGVVELTLALLTVYDTPEDKIVWDVGHQAYPYKILTGRRDAFPSIRKMGGLSGFLKREESPYDAFGAGHASTAISAALGMALARDKKGENHRVVAMVGDGSMTGGLCYEALNNFGQEKPDMLVILNDNEMSISPNIGGISHYFNQLLTTDFYNRYKQSAKELIRKAGAVGERAIGITHRVEGSIKNLILPEETIFEKMGIRYLGPVDGHNLEELLEILEQLRDLSGPMLLHVKTKKGKGYAYSESDPERWHSGADFEIDTGEKVAPAKSKRADTPPTPTYTEVFGKTLVELAEKDERVVAISAAMAVGTGLSEFAKAFPERFHDVGIAETHAVTCAAGMACEGLRPVVTIYSTFLQRAIDHIAHDVALQKLHVTFAIDRAGLVGADGPTHHGAFDLTYLRMWPGVVVMAPRDEEQLRAMMATAASYEDGPICYRYPRAHGVGAPTDGPLEPVEIGTGEVLRLADEKAQSRVVIVSIGTMAWRAMSVAEGLEKMGIAASVADARFVKPLDENLIKGLAKSHDLVVTLEDNVITGGFGSAVGELLHANAVATPLMALGLPDQWVEHGGIEELFESVGLGVDAITQRIAERFDLRESGPAELKQRRVETKKAHR